MDKVCAIFGGSRGIGRAVAQLMARKGYHLVIIARNLEGAKAAAGALGGDHLAFKHGLPLTSSLNTERVLGAAPHPENLKFI
uniref:CBR4 n=1 Tax=Piliocolobus tephrosceles TaxID=591936 RepID=A0A8C9I3R5_9PRIM